MPAAIEAHHAGVVGEQGRGHEDVRDHVPDEEGALHHDLPSTATADRVRNQFYIIV